MKDSIDVEVQESKPNIVCNTAFSSDKSISSEVVRKSLDIRS